MNRLVVTTSLLWSFISKPGIAYVGRSQRGIVLLNETAGDADNENIAVSGSFVERIEGALERESKQLQQLAGEAVRAVIEMAEAGNVGKQIVSGKVVSNASSGRLQGHAISNAFGSLYRSGTAGTPADLDDDEECKVETFDVFLVQDTSQTFQSDLNAAVKLMEDWILSIQDDYEGSRFGYGTFTDKPIPLSGFGPYGGWQNVKMQYDWCFEMEQKLVDDKDTFVASLKKVWKKKGSGFDLLESQFEALLRAAMSVDAGWDDERPEINPNTHVRVIVLITDASSHLNGDAADNIAKYNLPITLADPATLTTDGGWGSHAFSNTDMVNYMKEKSYKKLADLIAKETFGTGELTEKEEQEMNKQAEYFKPSVYPSVVPHPGDDSLRCEETEYPSPEQVAGVLTGRAIVPVILVINGDAPDMNKCSGRGEKDLRALQLCPVMFYQEWMAMYGIRGLVRSFTNDSEHTLSAMIEAVLDSASVICEDPILSTMPPPTRPPTTSSASTEPQDEQVESPTTASPIFSADVATPISESPPTFSYEVTYAPVSSETIPLTTSRLAPEDSGTPQLPSEATRAPQEDEAITKVAYSTTFALSSVSLGEEIATEGVVEWSLPETITYSSAAASEAQSEEQTAVAAGESTYASDMMSPTRDASSEASVPTQIRTSHSASSSYSVHWAPSSSSTANVPEISLVSTSGETDVPAGAPGETVVGPDSSYEVSALATSEETDVPASFTEETVEGPDYSHEVSQLSTESVYQSAPHQSHFTSESISVPSDVTSDLGEIATDESESESSSRAVDELTSTTLDKDTQPSPDQVSTHSATDVSHSAVTIALTTQEIEVSSKSMVSPPDDYFTLSTESHSSFLQKTSASTSPAPVYTEERSASSAAPTHPEAPFTDIEETPSPIYSDFETTIDEEVISEESTTGAAGNRTVVAIASAVGGVGALGAAALLAHTTGIAGTGGAAATANAAVESAPEVVANRESVQFVSQDMFA